MFCEFCRDPNIKVYENCFGVKKLLCDKCLKERYTFGYIRGWDKK